MNKKLALVVDDSPLARAVLRKLLIAHGLEVDTADSAETALVYLYTQQPDVIFMDHSMPGMNGFLAVKAIKNNPKTAMIPIMMYTSKEGDMYVSQARALGAIGVLPKHMEHAELENTLLDLKLINPSDPLRSENEEPFDSKPENLLLDKLYAYEKDEDLDILQLKSDVEDLSSLKADELSKAKSREKPEEKNTGTQNKARQKTSKSQANTTPNPRLASFFEHQTGILRSDLESASRQLSDKLINHINEELSHKLDMLNAQQASPNKKEYSVVNILLLCVLFALPVTWLASTNQTLKQNLQAQHSELFQLRESLNQTKMQITLNNENLYHQRDDLLKKSLEKNLHFYDSLEWAFNQNNSRPHNEPLFGNKALKTLSNLIQKLEKTEFNGTVKLIGHSGKFCFKESSTNDLGLANAGLPITECKINDASIQPEATFTEIQSIEFNHYLSSLLDETSGNIKIEIENKNFENPIKAYPLPETLQTAGEWNEIARQNNRLEVVIIPNEKNLVVDL